MLMTDELTGLQRVILDALRENGDWMTRVEIAATIGRNDDKLNYHDIRLLEQLCDLGLVERSERKLGVVLMEYIYRSTS